MPKRSRLPTHKNHPMEKAENRFQNPTNKREPTMAYGRTKLSMLTAFLFVMCGAATAQDSRAFAQMGVATWSAFECSALAGHIKNAGEQERLFRYGFEQGKAFIAAVQAGKVSKADLDKHVPVGVLWLLQGPSADFMLGRIFESAIDHALEDVFKTGEKFNNDELQQMLAQNKFRNSNCELLGTH